MAGDDLIARLQVATEESRELDAEIMFDLYAQRVGKHPVDGGPTGYLWPEDNPSWVFGIRFPGKDRDWLAKTRKGHEETLVIERDGALVLMNSLRVPPLTRSLDAALTLVVPDGLGWLIGKGKLSPPEPLYGVSICAINDPNEVHAEAEHDIAAIAICIAAMRVRGADPERTVR